MSYSIDITLPQLHATTLSHSCPSTQSPSPTFSQSTWNHVKQHQISFTLTQLTFPSRSRCNLNFSHDPTFSLNSIARCPAHKNPFTLLSATKPDTRSTNSNRIFSLCPTLPETVSTVNPKSLFLSQFNILPSQVRRPNHCSFETGTTENCSYFEGIFWDVMRAFGSMEMWSKLWASLWREICERERQNNWIKVVGNKLHVVKCRL